MIKKKIIAVSITILILILVILPTSYATSKKLYNYSKYDYEIINYNIDMVVNENNTFDITETITANFNISKHGIFRKIPLRNNITRLDGTKSNNTAQISNISVSEKYTTYNENGYKVIKIGDANKTLTGNKTYTIKYTYNIGKDPLKNADELYFNLIGNEWDTIIDNVSFKITMPKSFDKSLLGFSSGNTGSTNSSNVSYNVIGNTITGTVNNTLIPGEALTVRMTLPDRYFIGAGHKIDKFSIFVIITCLLFVIISYKMWKKYGKDEQVIETVEFYPPEGYNSAEIAFLYEGKATDKGIISLLIYLADKGYIKIEEIEEKVLLSKTKSFKITKLKEYDGNNKYEKIFFKGLFKGANAEKRYIEKATEIMEKSKLNGEEMSCEEALELSIEKSETTYESVTEEDLYDNFYTTLNLISLKLDSKKNKNKIFQPVSSKKSKWLILMSIISFILIALKPMLEYRTDGMIACIIAILFPGIGLAMLLGMVFGQDDKAVKFFGLFFGGFWLCVTWSALILPTLLYNMFYILTYFIGTICIAIILILLFVMPKRSDFGNEILGKIKGFKRFLETAEKQELESLVMQNPEYFYNILPYTYALGISDKWIKQFETIALKAPQWYNSNNDFSIHTFETFMNNTMKSASTAMSSNPSSSSGGSSSGGGSSGGGSGGGGGGSW